MNPNGLTLDQFLVFTFVAEDGSFSATARRMNRAQSAVTYAIQKLEDQLGVLLFDRSAYPTVPTRIYVASLGATADLVLDGTCTLGIALTFAIEGTDLRAHPIETVSMVAVAAPCHPLSALRRPISTDELQQHVQLVLTDHSGRTDKRDNGVLSRRNWRLGDLSAKHAMLLGGLGWGGMPLHMVQTDIEAGRLCRIEPEEWGLSTGGGELSMCLIHRNDHLLGPAARWLSDWLISGAEAPPYHAPDVQAGALQDAGEAAE